MMMRDPAEIAEENRLKEEAKLNKKKENAALFKALWESYLQYYSFEEVKKIADSFFDVAELDGLDIESRNIMVALGHTAEKVCISTAGATSVGKARIKLRYGERRSESKFTGDIANTVHNSPGLVDTGRTEWTLADVIKFTWEFEQTFLKEEPSAGFSPADIEGFTSRYDHHRGSYPELMPQHLWGLLEDCDFYLPTPEDQQHVIDVMHEVDVNCNGTLDVAELLQLIRALLEEKKAAPHKREHGLLEQSGMELTDIEEWYGIYQAALEARTEVEQNGANAGTITMSDVKAVFERISIKWDKDGTKKMKEWLFEVDENFTGYIRFGEFCCLVQRMYETNFANIKTLMGGK